MDLRAAKELVHIRTWLTRVDEIVLRGKDAYLADDLLQEAGGSRPQIGLTTVEKSTGRPSTFNGRNWL
jgi:hypothetical protein